MPCFLEFFHWNNFLGSLFKGFCKQYKFIGKYTDKWQVKEPCDYNHRVTPWWSHQENTVTPWGIFILIPSRDKWTTKAKVAPSPHGVWAHWTPNQYSMSQKKYKGKWLKIFPFQWWGKPWWMVDLKLRFFHWWHPQSGGKGVMKFWAILQMVLDSFLGSEYFSGSMNVYMFKKHISFFHHM